MSANGPQLTGDGLRILLEQELRLTPEQFGSELERVAHLTFDRSTIYRWLHAGSEPIPKTAGALIQLYLHFSGQPQARLPGDGKVVTRVVQANQKGALKMPPKNEAVLRDYIDLKSQLAKDRQGIRDDLNAEALELAEMDRFCAVRVPESVDQVNGDPGAWIRVASNKCKVDRVVSDKLLEEVVGAVLTAKLGLMGLIDSRAYETSNAKYAAIEYERQKIKMLLVIVSASSDGMHDFSENLHINSEKLRGFIQRWVAQLRANPDK